MTTGVQNQVRVRRRGEQLESELLDAAWDELIEVGFANLTMESVAARARTGIAVLCRRWANKDQLVFATLAHYRNGNPVAVPDTGALRSDLLAQLTALSEAFAGFFAIASAAVFSGLLADSGLTPPQVRDKVMAAQRLPRVRIIYRRALHRGEIDIERTPSAVLAMPFDLVRHDLLMDLKPLKPARIQTIVDELFLPLVQHHQGRITRPKGSSVVVLVESQGRQAARLTVGVGFSASTIAVEASPERPRSAGSTSASSLRTRTPRD